MFLSYSPYLKAAENYWRAVAGSVFRLKLDASPRNWLATIIQPFHQYLMKYISFRMKRQLLFLCHKPAVLNRKQKKILTDLVLKPLASRLAIKFSTEKGEEIAVQLAKQAKVANSLRIRRNEAQKRRNRLNERHQRSPQPSPLPQKKKRRRRGTILAPPQLVALT